MIVLHVRVWGDEGEEVVLVHGSMSTGRTTWFPQKSLADEGFRLIVPDRRGYGQSPDQDGEDFEVDGADVASLLEDGAHLVGHSYGALGAMFAAARRPSAVRSLVLVEPPAFSLAADDPAVQEILDGHRSLWAKAEDLDDREFMERFVTMMGADLDSLSEDLLDMWARRTRPMRLGRPAWEADIPVEELAGADFSAMVVSGGHSEGFEAVCDELAAAVGARRETIEGFGHEVQRNAEPFNDLLLDFWRPS